MAQDICNMDELPNYTMLGFTKLKIHDIRHDFNATRLLSNEKKIIAFYEVAKN